MSGDATSAWLFVHPDVEAGSEAEPGSGRDAGGLQVNARGGVAIVTQEAAVRQAILLLLSTAPGERVMRPEYGCRLQHLVFEPNDATTAGLAIHYVRRALERWEPRIHVLDVDAEAHPERADLLVITLQYRLRASARTEQLTIPVDMRG
jgi:uncharacterized protein